MSDDEREPGRFTESAKQTEATRFVQAKLFELIGEDSPWASGLLVLTYRREGAAEHEVNFANAMAMRVNEQGALHMVLMVKFLRHVALELERTLDGQRPLPEQPEP